ncbi:MAG: Lrp/AsnC family transcriptional regulator [Marinomonas sp.]
MEAANEIYKKGKKKGKNNDFKLVKFIKDLILNVLAANSITTIILLNKAPSMNHIELDSYDWRLLQALQQNARLSNVALSEQVNLSPSQCSRRLQRLEQHNIIESYFTQLNANELGYKVTAFIYVTLDKNIKNSDPEFKSTIANMPQILECYSISGDSDYWLKVISEDLPSLSVFLNESISILSSVKGITSTVVLDKIKQVPSIPLPN